MINRSTQTNQSSYLSTITPNILAGLISGLMTVIASISYSTLIFSGQLSGLLQIGIVSALISACIIGFIIAFKSSSIYSIAGPDANISAIMALTVTTVSSHLQNHGSAESLVINVWMTLVISTVLSGGFLFLVGYYKLGYLIRYIPYPVIGGFLAGTGWLLCIGSFKVMYGYPLSLNYIDKLLTMENVYHWVPGMIFSLILLLVLRRYKHFLVMPTLLIIGIVITHIILYAYNISFLVAEKEGWLLTSFPADLIGTTYKSLSLSHIDLSALSSGAGNLFALIIVTAIIILLNAASIELTTKQDVNLDTELKVSGIANLIGAPFGALTGCTALSRSILNYKAKASTRLSGYVSAIFCGLVILLLAPSLSLFPKPILGGLLFYLGFSLLIEWVVDGWKKLSRFDYLLVIMILCIVGLWGFLPGVGIGLVISCMIFAFNYSHIDVIKTSFNGKIYHSNVERSFSDQKILRKNGDQILIYKLQGYIFFGTAYPLLSYFKQIFLDKREGPVKYIILDFFAITGVDSSSIQSFNKLKEILYSYQAVLIFVKYRLL